MRVKPIRLLAVNETWVKYCGFYCQRGRSIAGENIENIGVLPMISNGYYKDKKTQFIVAVESNQSEMRNTWLRNFMIKGFRYVSVIPTLRGMPLDSTDMSFILVMKL
jgi:undecaprenyl-phosphate galactose phosphotransferase